MANICSGQHQITFSILTGIVRAVTKVHKKAIKCSEQHQMNIILIGIVRAVTKVHKKVIKCLGTSIFFSVLTYCLHRTFRILAVSWTSTRVYGVYGRGSTSVGWTVAPSGGSSALVPTCTQLSPMAPSSCWHATAATPRQTASTGGQN